MKISGPTLDKSTNTIPQSCIGKTHNVFKWIHHLTFVALHVFELKWHLMHQRSAVEFIKTLCVSVFQFLTIIQLLMIFICLSIPLSPMQYFPAYHIFGVLLSALVVLHVFWAYFIFKTAYIAFFTPGAIKSDSRSDSEDDSEWCRRRYTGWQIRLSQTSRWHQNKSSVLAWPGLTWTGQNGTFVLMFGWCVTLYVLQTFWKLGR